MATKKAKPATAISVTQLRQGKKVSLGNDFVLVKIGNAIDGTIKPREQAQVLVNKAAIALKVPGITRASVFQASSAGRKVFAYSTHPKDSSMLIREAEDGTRQVGKIGSDGRFRVLRKSA